MVYTYYMVCVTCVLIEQLVPAWPLKKFKRGQTSPNVHILPLTEIYRLPLVVRRGCFAAKNLKTSGTHSIYSL